MVSGVLLLDTQRQESARAFYRRRLHRLAVPICVWTVFYLALRIWRDQEDLGAQQIVSAILQGRPYAHLWYLYMVPGLYLVTPALRRLIQVSTPRQRMSLIVVITLAADAYHLANVQFWGIPSSIFFMFIPFMGYYLLGHELLLHPPKFRAKVLVGAVLVASAYLALLARPFMAFKGQQYNTFFLCFFGPPVALIAILVFVTSARHRRAQGDMSQLDRFFARVAPLTLGIYVIHVAVLETLGTLAGGGGEDGNLAVGLIAGPIIAFALSAAITAILLKIPYVRRIVG